MRFAAIAQSVNDFIWWPVACAAAIVLVWFVWRLSNRPRRGTRDAKLSSELGHAAEVARELTRLTNRVMEEVQAHQREVAEFAERVDSLRTVAGDDGWKGLRAEADALVAPTLRLATNFSSAHDQLRRRCSRLMNLAGSRNDLVTGVFNRRAFEEQLDVQFSLRDEQEAAFSLALLEIAQPESDDRKTNDARFAALARLTVASARNSDFVARYSGEELVVLMPKTPLAGAKVLCQRLMAQCDGEIDAAVFGAVVEVHGDDTPERILSRAGSALYSARANGKSCLFAHDGVSIRAQAEPASKSADDPSESSDETASTDEQSVVAQAN